MIRPIYALSLSAIYCVGLSACATAPKAETLMTGISADTLSKPANGQLRSESDPICQSFYANAKNYITEANKPDPGGRFLTSVGIAVLAGVATGGIASSGISSTMGQIVAQTATSAAVYQGSTIALEGIKESSGPASKITTAAEELSCPVTFSI